MCAVQDGDDLIMSSQFLALRLRHLEHLDEVEQATWVTCYQPEQYRPGSRFVPWLLGIAQYCAQPHAAGLPASAA